MNVLGVSAYYHDAAAALMIDGRVVAAAAEERFTRVKHDAELPHQAIRYCLQAGGILARDLQAVVFYEKPLVKLDRILTSQAVTFPRSLGSFVRAMPSWGRKKLVVGKHLGEMLYSGAPVLYADHHASHAAASFFDSPFDRAVVLTVDAVGEWATTAAGIAEGTSIRLEREIRFPHSLGLFYSAITHHLGFRPNEDEWKVMALGAFGRPSLRDRVERLIHLCADGSFRLAMEHFDHHRDPRVLLNRRGAAILGLPPRAADAPLEQAHFDLAASAQIVLEEALLRLLGELHQRYRCDDLCLSGGVALNCVANGRLLSVGPFRRVHVPPAPGDDGGAVGAAMLVHHAHTGRRASPYGPYLGPAYDHLEVARLAQLRGAEAHRLEDADLVEHAAASLANGRVIGWFQGRMELGPRALGNRSILATPADARVKTRINAEVKKREWFRPLAPAVLDRAVSDWFHWSAPSPYMSFVARAREERADEIPAVLHADRSARLQTVRAEDNPLFARLIEAFERRTGLPLLLNTSLNGPGEPIACSPEDALRTAVDLGLDEIYLGRTAITIREEADDVRARRRA